MFPWEPRKPHFKLKFLMMIFQRSVMNHLYSQFWKVVPVVWCLIWLKLKGQYLLVIMKVNKLFILTYVLLSIHSLHFYSQYMLLQCTCVIFHTYCVAPLNKRQNKSTVWHLVGYSLKLYFHCNKLITLLPYLFLLISKSHIALLAGR